MLEAFEKFVSAPFRSPGCHDDEKRERTLSCGALCARPTCWNGPRASCMWSQNDLMKQKPWRSIHPTEVLKKQTAEYEAAASKTKNKPDAGVMKY